MRMSFGLWTSLVLAALALSCCVPPGAAKLLCGDGYEYQLSSNQEFCFLVNLEPKTYQDASDYCYSKGGHLAEPRTYLKDVSLTDFLRQKAYLNNNHWIGLTKDPHSYFKWVWKGTGMADEGYSQWRYSGRALNGRAGDKRCVYKSGISKSSAGSMWVATNCKDALKLPFVCEQDITCQSTLGWVSRTESSPCARLMSVTRKFSVAGSLCHRFGGALPVIYNPLKDNLDFFAAIAHSRDFWLDLRVSNYGNTISWRNNIPGAIVSREDDIWERNKLWYDVRNVLLFQTRSSGGSANAYFKASAPPHKFVMAIETKILSVVCEVQGKQIQQYHCPQSNFFAHSRYSPCLTFVEGTWNVSDAEEICRKRRSTLPSISSYSDLYFISSLVLRHTQMQGPTTWLALQYVAKDTYKWQDIRDFPTISVTKASAFWQDLEPNGGAHEKYVVLNNYNQKFIDVSGRYYSSVLCQAAVCPEGWTKIYFNEEVPTITVDRRVKCYTAIQNVTYSNAEGKCNETKGARLHSKEDESYPMDVLNAYPFWTAAPLSLSSPAWEPYLKSPPTNNSRLLQSQHQVSWRPESELHNAICVVYAA